MGSGRGRPRDMNSSEVRYSIETEGETRAARDGEKIIIGQEHLRRLLDGIPVGGDCVTASPREISGSKALNSGRPSQSQRDDAGASGVLASRK